MSDKREHLRTPLKATVKLMLSDKGEIKLTMRDVSNGGVFVITDGVEPPPLGSVVKIQIQGMMEDAPVISAKVVRVNDEGFGLKFTD